MLLRLFILLIMTNSTALAMNSLFKSHQFVDQGYRSDDIATGDFNGDGFIDLFVVSESHSHRVYFNDSTTVFKPSKQTFGHVRGSRVLVGDFDNDGDLDVWVGADNKFTSSHLDYDQIYLNDGNGYFLLSEQRPAKLETGNNTRMLASADIDNDGDLDVIRAINGSTLTTPAIFRNDGNGHFTQELQEIEFIAATFADYDGDGYQDIWTIGLSLTIFLNDKTGHFNASRVVVSPFGESINEAKNVDNMVVKDFDGDGDLDVQGFTKHLRALVDPEYGVVIIPGDTATRLPRYINNADGTFTFQHELQSYNEGGHPDGVFIDLDGDSQLELVALGNRGMKTEVYETLNDGTFSITEVNIDEEHRRRSISAADFDNDGDDDIVTVGLTGNINIWLNHNSDFIKSIQPIMSQNSGASLSFATLDINLDGFIDYATADSNGISTYLGDGRGHFKKSWTKNSYVFYVEITTADFNGDGYKDLTLVRSGDQPHEIWLNNHDGTFNLSPEQFNSDEVSYEVDVSAADFDQDGDQDLLFVNYLESIEVWENDGQANFSLMQTINGRFYDAKFIDMEPGGFLEVLSYKSNTSFGRNHYQVYQFNSPIFELNPVYENFDPLEFSTVYSELITFDWDKDGDIDVIKSNQYFPSETHPRTILINEGPSGFVEKELFIEEAHRRSKIIGAQDVNNDGLIDFFTNNNNVHINMGDRSFETELFKTQDETRVDKMLFLDFDNDGDSDIISILDRHGMLNLNNTTIDQDFSGLWYNPAQSGHGLQIDEMFIAGQKQLFVSWYVYKNGEPIWISGSGPVNGNSAEVNMIITQGAEFLPDFDTEDVEQIAWGQMTINMLDKNDLNISWSPLISSFTSGEISMQRLTSIAEVSTRASIIKSCHSGSWYNSEQSGHGFMVQVLDSNDTKKMFMTWFTYLNGQQFWILAQGNIVDNKAVLSAISARGGNFPPDFDVNDVEFDEWGTITFQLIDDTNARVNWHSIHADFLTGEFLMSKLTFIDRYQCD